jgi:GH43 family beta-xylosidase
MSRSSAAEETPNGREVGQLVNPIMVPGADPWVVLHEGWYYYTDTHGNRIELRRSRSLGTLRGAPPVVIWRAPDSGPNSRSIWAPEFHRIGERWFLYYTATSRDDGDANRRIFVLESKTADLLGEWIDRGKLAVPANDDEYAIDGTVYSATDGRLYFLWSGREQSKSGPQCLYIAEMENAWTLKSPRVRISAPEYDWETQGWPVNEGPQILERDGRLFVVYSASGYSTLHYCLGLLEHQGGDLLDAKSWKKEPKPVFSSLNSVEPPVIGPGHCSFTKSPDGREDWIVYHAREGADIRKNLRNVRAQPFHWTAEGKPDFGEPVRTGVSIAAPSGGR